MKSNVFRANKSFSPEKTQNNVFNIEDYQGDLIHLNQDSKNLSHSCYKQQLRLQSFTRSALTFQIDLDFLPEDCEALPQDASPVSYKQIRKHFIRLGYPASKKKQKKFAHKDKRWDLEWVSTFGPHVVQSFATTNSYRATVVTDFVQAKRFFTLFLPDYDSKSFKPHFYSSVISVDPETRGLAVVQQEQWYNSRRLDSPPVTAKSRKELLQETSSDPIEERMDALLTEMLSSSVEDQMRSPISRAATPPMDIEGEFTLSLPKEQVDYPIHLNIPIALEKHELYAVSSIVRQIECFLRIPIEPQGFFLSDQAANNLANALSSMELKHEVSPELTQLLLSLSNNTTILTRMASNTAEAVNSVQPALSSFGECIKLLVDSLPYVLPMLTASALVYYHVNPSDFAKNLAVGSCVALMGYAAFKGSTIISEVLSFMSKERPKENVMEYQNWEDGCFKALKGLVLLMFSLPKEWKESLEFHPDWSKLSNFPKISASLAEVARFVVELVQDICNQFHKYYNGVSPFRWLTTGSIDIDEWLEELDEFQRLYDSKELNFTLVNEERIIYLYEKGNKILRSISNHPQNRNSINVLTRALNQLGTIKQVFSLKNLRHEGIRVEPVVVVALGPPGVGKSDMLQSLMYSLLPHLVPQTEFDTLAVNPGNYIYVITPEVVHWDTYDSNKPIAVWDEFMQIKDTPTNPEGEPMKFIRIANIFEATLHMAALESKGSTKFRSKLIIISTNEYNFNVSSIISNQALLRRFDLVYEVGIKPEYRPSETNTLNKFDPELLPKGPLGTSSLNPSVQTFRSYSYVTKERGPIITFEQVKAEVLHKLKVKETRHTQHSQELINMLKSEIDNIKSVAYQNSDEDPDEGYNMEYLIVRMRTEKPKLWKKILDKALADPTDPFWEQYDTLQLMRRIFEKAKPNLEADTNKEFLDSIPHNCLRKHELEDDVPEVGPLSWVSKVRETIAEVTDVAAQFTPFVLGVSFPVICAAMITTASCVGLFNLMRPSAQKNEEAPLVMEDLFQSYNPKQNHVPAVVHRQPAPLSNHRQAFAALKPISSQGLYSPDNTAHDIINKIAHRNSYRMWLPDCEMSCGVVTFVADRIILINVHFLTIMLEKAQESVEFAAKNVTLVSVASNYRFLIPVHEFGDIYTTDRLTKQDVAFVRFPKIVHPHPNIVNHFFPEEMLTRITSFQIIFSSFQAAESGKPARLSTTTVPAVKTDRVFAKTRHGGEVFLDRIGYYYLLVTQKGDCGNLLFIDNEFTGSHKILGIHSAGDQTTKGFGTSVTKEMVEEAIQFFQPVISEDLPVEPQANFEVDPQFAPLILSEFPVPQPRKSKLVRTRLDPSKMNTQITKVPPRLTPFMKLDVQVDPLDIALRAYGTNTSYIPSHILSEAVDSTWSYMLANMANCGINPRVLTFEEAVKGVEFSHSFKSVNRSSSLGYPLSKQYKGKGKAGVYGPGPEFNLTTANALDLRKRVEDIVDNASRRVRLFHVYMDCLKDETVPLLKFQEGRTRVFSAISHDLDLALRMYFGSFCMWLIENKIDNQCAIGVNPYSNEWDFIAHKLSQFGIDSQNIGAGDFSRFDASHSTQLLWAVYRIIEKYYEGAPEEENAVRETLWCEVINSRHIRYDQIYQWHGGLPSGISLTAPINCLAVLILFRVMFGMVYGEEELYAFNSSVYCIAMGDDHVFAVDDYYLERFNMKRLEFLFSTIGYKYTSATKGEVGRMQSLEECTFLKRSFRRCLVLHRWVAPLDLESIFNPLLWVRKGKDSEGSVEAAISLALQELALHGREIWSEYAPLILKESERKHYKLPNVTTFLQLLFLVSGREARY
ncbi:hypothetical protein 1 [Forsythia suspensa dicistrovirus]|nr:hypothetical protein 1 [Forsythia suspensa dicistrovirus]QKE44122.1 hypothetical protein 1 [Trichosanthes kirilowii dicistrovirus]